METDERDAAIGRAVRRLLELAAADETLRAGLEALAQSIREATGRPGEGRAEAAELGPNKAAITEVDAGRLAPVEAEVRAGAEPDTPAATEGDEPVEPMDRAAFMRLMEEVAHQAEPAELGSVAAALREAVGGPATVTPEPPAASDERVHAPEPAPESTREERDAILPALVERTRLKAELARAVADKVRTGSHPDGALLHRARSAHCSLWILELREPDPDALDGLAGCFSATSDALELVHRLRVQDATNHERFAAAVRRLAAVQSALRVAAGRLRPGEEDDQVAAFGWLKKTTAAERIFVERHMRLDDPLDPAEVPAIAEQVRAELEAIREEKDRAEARERGFKQVRYHVGRIAKGKVSAHDGDKVVEAVTELVAEARRHAEPATLRPLRDVDHLAGLLDDAGEHARG